MFEIFSLLSISINKAMTLNACLSMNMLGRVIEIVLTGCIAIPTVIVQPIKKLILIFPRDFQPYYYDKYF
jgi:hypothetical protein